MDKKLFNNIITQALKEDAAKEDITTNALVPASSTTEAVILFKEDAVLCGLSIARQVFQNLDKNILFRTDLKDGDAVKKNSKVAFIKGKTRAILTGERTALNFLGYLSGIATNTRQFVDRIKPFKTKILDTRKTTPGLRELEKYAVRCGGGYNHRTSLKDMVLIKDNHRVISKRHLSLVEMIEQCRTKTKKPLEIEVDNLTQLQEALRGNPDYILLDNMSIPQLKQAVKITRSSSHKKPLLEASGGIRPNNVKAIAQTGVDRISIGALTHHRQAIDVSLEIIN
ncbi:MAG TPA: carboxylating nicotinate-nucleotide diphosphorylase [Candidatus Omnitrophica bacterium]|nr:MAG: nicotinate-nucleotide diphosphorylase (carboxylating) [Omnitrophica WOR_2 bacterium GWA2_45_18]HBR15545.1 carboxylating nicotinate-nucleotide diphosphorylase [Candidatus Omnitrophota bacterium]